MLRNQLITVTVRSDRWPGLSFPNRFYKNAIQSIRFKLPPQFLMCCDETTVSILATKLKPNVIANPFVSFAALKDYSQGHFHTVGSNHHWTRLLPNLKVCLSESYSVKLRVPTPLCHSAWAPIWRERQSFKSRTPDAIINIIVIPIILLISLSLHKLGWIGGLLPGSFPHGQIRSSLDQTASSHDQSKDDWALLGLVDLDPNLERRKKQ